MKQRKVIGSTQVLLLMLAAQLASCASSPDGRGAVQPSQHEIEAQVIDIEIATALLSAEEVERQFAEPLEARLGSIAGVERITSSSSSDGCRISLFVSPTQNVEEVKLQVREHLELAQDGFPSIGMVRIL